MIRYLLDTNIVIEVLRHRPEALRRRFADNSGRLGISSITVSELYFGAEKSSRREDNLNAIEAFLPLVEILDFNAGAASHAGELRAALARSGTPIGPYDVLIAGHARSLGLTVVTNNLKEFSRVEGLRVEDWLT